MHFPFRRDLPTAWSLRLPQLQRRGTVSEGVEQAARIALPPPEPGGTMLSLTRTPSSVAIGAKEVVADPAGAELLPSSALAAALRKSDTENHALRRRLHAHKTELEELRKSMSEHVIEDAELRGRLRTLEEVIAALHANLEDLRLQRDQLLASR